MSLKQREAKFIVRIKIIDPQQGQPIDTYTLQLIWKLSIAPLVSVVLSGFAGLKIIFWMVAGHDD